MNRVSPCTERLALLALAVGLAVMGCGDGSDEGAAAPASQGQREAETEVRGEQGGEPGPGDDGEDGIDQDGEPGESASSQSGSISQSSSGQSNSISQSSNGGSTSTLTSNGTKTFSGTGITKLTFGVERPSRLVWTNSEGRRFSANGGGISIDSRAGRGEVALDEDRYDDVRVSGASWTIVVRPR